MKRKALFLLGLLAVIAALIIYIYWASYGKYYPTKVLWLPDGFVHLRETTKDTKGVMEYVFLEEYISLIDINGVGVGGAPIRDSSFIVRYRGEYYVNAEKFYAALEKAKDKHEWDSG